MSLQDKLILVIEDESELRDILASELRAAGFRIVTAENGRDGYEKVVAEQPDLVLSDIMMPEMNGYDFLRRVRADRPELDMMPVMFLTALGDESDKIAALALGVDDYINKPFEFSLLIPQIEARLGQIDRISAVGGGVAAMEAARYAQPAASAMDAGWQAGAVRVAAVCSRNTTHIEDVSAALSERGYEVFGTSSGEDLLTSLPEKVPEIVFLSYLTRDVAGFYVASRIKQMTKGGLPVILIGDPDLPISAQQLPESYDDLIFPTSAGDDIDRIKLAAASLP